ncbi:hypothetical protein [Runella salmonicolor]|uniref:DUF5683 domain-containing protein n=1 Tax=Runella salmonicolor TaxID=2950278 RepID=A0ABT1FJH6_9BACT|nr:hypothetical protein [Runella salmonicolor]MCP1381906.1 hypothetical protein [Runella salmonicolor]
MKKKWLVGILLLITSFVFTIKVNAQIPFIKKKPIKVDSALKITNGDDISDDRIEKNIITNIKIDVDTIKKFVKFQYKLLQNLKPKDSLYIIIKRSGKPDYHPTTKSLEGDVGTNIRNNDSNFFLWYPLKDTFQVAEPVDIVFKINKIDNKPFASKRISKKEIITYSRWAVSAALFTTTLAQGIPLSQEIKKFNNEPDPININQKKIYDNREAELKSQRSKLVRSWATYTGLSILGNLVPIFIKPLKLNSDINIHSNGTSISVSYNF